MEMIHQLILRLQASHRSLALGLASSVLALVATGCVKSSVDPEIAKQASVSNLVLTQVLPAGVTGQWQVSSGDFAGFAIDYNAGSFDKDLTVKVRLLGVPPRASLHLW